MVNCRCCMPRLLCVDAIGKLRLPQASAGVGCGGRRPVPLEAAAVEGGCYGNLRRLCVDTVRCCCRGKLRLLL